MQRQQLSLHDVVLWVCDEHEIGTFVPGCPECKADIERRGGKAVRNMEGQWVGLASREVGGKLPWPPMSDKND